MFNLFRNKMNNSQPAMANMAAGLNKKVIDCKIRFAAMLTKKTQNWSVRKWKLFLIIFCVVSAGISGYTIIDSLSGSKTAHDYTVLPFLVPKYSTKPDGLQKLPGYIISEREYDRLRQFDHYMDSIGNTQSGKPTYDSIVKYRSGLLDSIRLIEQIYLSQRK